MIEKKEKEGKTESDSNKEGIRMSQFCLENQFSFFSTEIQRSVNFSQNVYTASRPLYWPIHLYGLNKEIESWCVLFEKIDQVIKM